MLNSTYSSLRSIYGGAPWVFSAGTDLFAGGKQGVDAIGLYGSSYNSSDKDVQEFYTECYKGIQLANSVIYYGESTEDSSVKLQYVDEARFLRAYYYYLLVQHFGGVALNKTMFESAVMNHARESAENVYQFVIDEFSYLASDDSQLLERSEATGDNFDVPINVLLCIFLPKLIWQEAMKHLPTAMTSPMQPCVPRKP